MVRHAGDHDHLVTVRHPASTVLVGSTGRRIDLRREVMADEEDPQRQSVRARSYPTSWARSRGGAA
jgi:hypothetical protein